MREFLRRRAAGYKAYYENMPLRPSSMPQGPDMRLYRRINYGDLAQFSVLDTRQYRTDQPCGDGFKERCARALSDRQTMTGPGQERWLKEGMCRSRARWNVAAQQTMLAEYDFRAGPMESFNMDQWDGYVAARNRLIGFFDRAKVRNPITLTGDIHSAWVHDLKTDFSDENSNRRHRVRRHLDHLLVPRGLYPRGRGLTARLPAHEVLRRREPRLHEVRPEP